MNNANKVTEALIFDVDQDRFGICSTSVKQVLQAVTISKLLGSPNSIEGIINFHGQVIPVLAFRRLFQLPTKELEPSHHLIIIETTDCEFAIRVDRAVDLIQLDADTLEEARVTVGGVEFMGTIARTPHGLIHILDTSQFLSPAESTAIADHLQRHASEGR